MHIQRTSHLSSQECVLGDNLIQACDAMNLEALEEVQSRSVPHCFALANLEQIVRELMGKIRVSGCVKNEKAEGRAVARGALVSLSNANVATAATAVITKHMPPKEKNRHGRNSCKILMIVLLKWMAF